MTQHKSSDRNTIWLITGSVIGLIGSYIERAYFSESIFFDMTNIGTALLIGRILFKLYAIHIIRKDFSAAVARVENKKQAHYSHFTIAVGRGENE
ncbi:hypothetical protein BH11BAC1_BH11BAC1_04310 [soil metagenome]